MEENKEKIINMRQVSKFQNGKVLFEINDDLKRAGYNERETQKVRDLFGKIHARYSGFRIVARDYSQGTGDKLIDLDLRLGPEEVKSIAEDVFEKIKDRRTFELEQKAAIASGTHYKNIINTRKEELDRLTKEEKEKGIYPTTNVEKLKEDIAYAKMSFANAQCEYQLAKQKIELMSDKVFVEQKISPNTISKDSQYSKVTTLTIEYNTKMKIPWTIIVENGLGIREQTSTGGYKIKSQSYKDGKRIRMFLSDNDIRKLFRKASDYVKSWETTNLSHTMKQRQEYETIDKQNYFNNVVNKNN